MPWLSRTPSPASSPRGTSPVNKASVAPVTYIPPLIDGACGTVPRAETPVWRSLRQDASAMWRMVPAMCWTAWGVCIHRRRGRSWADFRDLLAHATLIIIQVSMLVAFLPFWITLPGAAVAGWVTWCLIFVFCFSRPLNGPMKERIMRSSAGLDGWMMGQEVSDEQWIFVNGMGVSSRQLSRSTLPMLSRLFGRSMTAVHMPTYGVPFDLISLLLQRTMLVATPSNSLLYRQIRTALIDSTMQRVVVIAHNTGAVPTSQVISQLCADLPASKMSKLEVYTFGSAGYEFLLPVRYSNEDQHQPAKEEEPRKGVHVEHFALVSDPFAQFGVLRSIRQSLITRFCGGLFIIDDQKLQGRGANQPSSSMLASGLSMHEYVKALFPGQLSHGKSLQLGALESVMTIDRDIAEKREFAAISNNASSRSSKENKKRLSWTGLGATAGQKNGLSDGVIGLEMARRGCRDCDGLRGSEISWLARYVNAGSAIEVW